MAYQSESMIASPLADHFAASKPCGASPFRRSAIGNGNCRIIADASLPLKVFF
jgi:hypothetical protein